MKKVKNHNSSPELEWAADNDATQNVSDISMSEGEKGGGKDVFRQKGLSCRREILLSLIGLLATFVATVFFVWELGRDLILGEMPLAESLLFLGMALGLIYGNMVYQLTRIGYFRRLHSHVPARQVELNSFFAMNEPPTLTVLVPSYKEDHEVIRRTLLSAALQEYPYKKIVLLIDNPPQPTDEGDQALLQAARQLPTAIQDLLSELVAGVGENITIGRFVRMQLGA